MTTVGMDPDQLEAFAVTLDRSADELRSMLHEGAGSVALATLGSTLSTIWQGPRAQNFANLWSSRHLAQLRGLERLLRDAANDVRREARQQRDTSTDLGGALTALGLSWSAAAALTGGLARDIDLWTGLPAWMAQAVVSSRDLPVGNLAEWRMLTDLRSLGYGFVGLSSFVAGALTDNRYARFGFEATGNVANMMGSVNSAANSFATAGGWLGKWRAPTLIGSVGPVLGMIGGSLTAYSGYSDIRATGADFGNVTQVLGGGAVAAGSLLMFTPLAPVGAAMVFGGTVVNAASWAYENREVIGEFLDDTADVISDRVDDAWRTVNDVNDAVGAATSKVLGWFS